MTDTVAHNDMPAVVGKLSTLDRFLPVWIGIAMAAGLLLGRLIPGLGNALSAVEVDGISLPIALGLLIMMYPVLAKVRYDKLDTVTGDRKLLVSSLVLNWLLGPHIATWNIWLRVLLNVAIIVPYMAWVGVPYLTTWLRGWLHP